MPIDQSVTTFHNKTVPGDLNTITNIANSSLANMAPGTFKARRTGTGTGAPEDITKAQALAALGLLAPLTGNTTFHVTTSGVDATSRTGLDNGANAWRTPQFAINTIASLYDFNGKTVTLQIGNGTYSSSSVPIVEITDANAWRGGGTLHVLGDNTTPSNVVFQTTGDDIDAISTEPQAALSGAFRVSGVKLIASGHGIIHGARGTMYTGPFIEIGNCTTGIGLDFFGADWYNDGTLTISGNGDRAIDVDSGSAYVHGTVAAVGTPHWNVFLSVRFGSHCRYASAKVGTGLTGIRVRLQDGATLQFDSGVGDLHGTTETPPEGGAVYADTAAGTTVIGVTHLSFGQVNGFGIYGGTGMPTFSAAQGSLFLRRDGSTTNNRAYINTNGSTGWTPIITAA
jgi:hypothetical protein